MTPRVLHPSHRRVHPATQGNGVHVCQVLFGAHSTWVGSDPSKLDDRQIARLFSDKNPEGFISTIFAGSLATYVAGQCFIRGEDGRGVYAGMLIPKQRRLGNAWPSARSPAVQGVRGRPRERAIPVHQSWRAHHGRGSCRTSQSQLHLQDALSYGSRIRWLGTRGAVTSEIRLSTSSPDGDLPGVLRVQFHHCRHLHRRPLEYRQVQGDFRAGVRRTRYRHRRAERLLEDRACVGYDVG